MSPHENSALTRRWIEEVWNQRRDETVRELLDPNSIGHLEGLVARGHAGFFEARGYLLGAFPDFHLTVDATLAEGDHVAFRWTAQGTHRGDLLGMRPSGRSVTFRGLTWLTFRDGKIVEGWDCWNQGRVFAELQAEPEERVP